MATQELHVVFGSGPLGMAVARALLAKGKSVRMVNRSGVAPVPDGIELRRGAANDPASTRQLCAGAAVVYQCAQPGYAHWPEQFPALQAGVMAGAAAAGAKLVVGDNLYMYGAVDGPIHEDLPYAATTRKGQVRARMAEAVLEAHQRGVVRATIGRASDFFGPGVLGSMLGERVFIPALRGKTASVPGNLDLPHTYTFIHDFGAALVTLGERDEALGQAWHVPNPETLTTRQVLTMIFAELGTPPRMSGMSRWMMALAGIFIPAARETVEMMYEFEQPFIVDHRKYAQAFGDHATPMREAIRQTIAWYRSQLQAAPVPAH